MTQASLNCSGRVRDRIKGLAVARFNFRYPSAEERSCVRSIAVHGLTGTANVGAVLLAVLPTNADPDAVKGASRLQRVHCPATFQERAA